MSHQIHSEHQKRKPKPIVGPGLGRDNLPQRPRDVLVGKGPLGDGLRENGVGACDARCDDEGREERDARHGGEHAERGAEPHDGHDGEQAERHFFPALQVVLGWELVARDDELDANHDASDTLGAVS